MTYLPGWQLMLLWAGRPLRLSTSTLKYDLSRQFVILTALRLDFDRKYPNREIQHTRDRARVHVDLASLNGTRYISLLREALSTQDSPGQW